jgi:hypothetical protein
LYRIVQEEAIKSNNVTAVLGKLKARYGIPDKQQIKTSGMRPKIGQTTPQLLKIKLFGIFQKHRNLLQR